MHEQEYNRNEFDLENPNNNNPNIIHSHLDIPFNISSDSAFRLSRISRTAIRNIQNKLTIKKFRTSESSNGNSEKCIICYEDFKNAEDIYSLPCHHLFHVDCLNREIQYRQKCPTCRKELNN